MTATFKDVANSVQSLSREDLIWLSLKLWSNLNYLHAVVKTDEAEFKERRADR